MENRPKMSREKRAKQFMPFAALTGLEEALRKKERELETVDKPTMSEDQLRELDDKLRSFEYGQMVTVKFYFEGTVGEVSGRFKNIDYLNKQIVLFDKTIKISSILELH
ncbi:MAG: YolD-like family protein [Clostridia bacterium]|nr:YolD-like family protein [Clostridia bacterium]